MRSIAGDHVRLFNVKNITVGKIGIILKYVSLLQVQTMFFVAKHKMRVADLGDGISCNRRHENGRVLARNAAAFWQSWHRGVRSAYFACFAL